MPQSNKICILVLCVNADAAKKFRIIIPLGDFIDDLKTTVYAYVGINVCWKFARLAAANANEN
jgi:hypothetical protein